MIVIFLNPLTHDQHQSLWCIPPVMFHLDFSTLFMASKLLSETTVYLVDNEMPKSLYESYVTHYIIHLSHFITLRETASYNNSAQKRIGLWFFFLFCYFIPQANVAHTF